MKRTSFSLHPILYRLALLLISISLSGCSGHTTVSGIKESGAVQLSAQQILELVDNNTLALESIDLSSHFYFNGSGALFVRDSNNNLDKGRWDVSDGAELCIKLSKWWHGDLLCYQVWSTDDRYHLANQDGLLIFSATAFSGDSQNLFQVSQKIDAGERRSIRGSKATQGVDRESKSPSPEESVPRETTDSNVQTDEGEQQQPVIQDESGTTIRMLARNCPGCNLAYADLKNADLVGADLSRADLQGADLSGANLRRADLSGANLQGIKLLGADLPGADLSGSNLKDADLSGANLYKADLSGARLTGAKLDGAFLSETKGLPQ